MAVLYASLLIPNVADSSLISLISSVVAYHSSSVLSSTTHTQLDLESKRANARARAEAARVKARERVEMDMQERQHAAVK